MPIDIDITQIDFDDLLKPGLYGAGIGPKYIGVHGQRGAGLSTIFETLATAVPYFLQTPIAQTMMETGKNIVQDIAKGENVKQTLARHGRQAVRKLTGRGEIRKRLHKSPIAVVIPHKKKRTLVKRSSKVSLF